MSTNVSLILARTVELVQIFLEAIIASASVALKERIVNRVRKQKYRELYLLETLTDFPQNALTQRLTVTEFHFKNVPSCSNDNLGYFKRRNCAVF